MAAIAVDTTDTTADDQKCAVAVVVHTLRSLHVATALIHQHRHRIRRRPRLPVRYPLFDKCISNDSEYHLHCRMNIAQARALCAALGLDASDNEYSGHYKYSAFRRFTAFLIQMGHSYHYRHLRSSFDWSYTSIHNNFNFWIDHIIAVLDADGSADNIRIWTARDFDDFRRNPNVQMFRHCIGCVDSIFIELYRPDNHELHSRYFSWYKGFDALFFTVMCDRLGRIRYCDGGAPPRRQSDQSSLGRAQLVLPSDLFILGDGHYHNDNRCKTPFRFEELSAYSGNERERMLRYNRSLRTQRILIEWIFSRIRGYFGIFDVRFTYDVHCLPSAFRAACLLYNHISRVRDVWPGPNMRYYHDAQHFPPQPADYVDYVDVAIPDEY
jgi:hypothetical protein